MKKSSRWSRYTRGEKGMTLVEIMIVLAILAAIAGVLVSTIMNRLRAAKVKQAKIQISEYMKQLDLYYTDCGSYPSTELGLEALVNQPEDGSCPDWGPDKYLKSVKKDPWKHEFIYELTENGPVLTSLGSDGKQGGTGDAKDISSDDG